MKLENIFEARNGQWIEDYWFKKIHMAFAPERADQRYWTYEMRVWRPVGKNDRGTLLLERIDKEFPRESLKELNDLRLHPDSINHRVQ